MKAPREPLLDFATLQYPVKVSFKEDGIRCLTHPTLGPVSRSFKPIRNEYIRAGMAEYVPSGLDGEIIIKKPDGTPLDFNEIQSAVMSVNGYPDYQFRVFDSFTRADYPFNSRWVDVKRAVNSLNDHERLTYVVQITADSPEEVQGFFEMAEKAGKEGIIIRSMLAPYKSGRVTEREGYMYKVVTFIREEATIVGFEPLLKNCNVANSDNFGRTKRSKHQAGMVPQELLGAFIVNQGRGTFNVSGFTAFQRDHYWQNQAAYLGKIITFKHKPHGQKDFPRSPIFIGFRDQDDL